MTDLTTTRAPFIEAAQGRGQLFIHQPYELYSEENHRTWGALYALQRPKWERLASRSFRKGIEALCLSPDRIPRLEEVNRFLEPLTGFQAKAVSGYVPADLFFGCLKRREFPTTITIRDGKQLGYLPEPDIFHDISGHVPMHTDPTFADLLVSFGRLGELAIERGESALNALSRLFWFTIEFGLIAEEGRICGYGSGLLSSIDELEHAVRGEEVRRLSFQLDQVVNQPFEIDRMQPLLFVIDSFEALCGEVERFEEWLLSGKLDGVVP